LNQNVLARQRTGTSHLR